MRDPTSSPLWRLDLLAESTGEAPFAGHAGPAPADRKH